MAKSKEWTSEKYGFSKAMSARLVFHSMLIVIAGFFGGLAWIIVWEVGWNYGRCPPLHLTFRKHASFGEMHIRGPS